MSLQNKGAILPTPEPAFLNGPAEPMLEGQRIARQGLIIFLCLVIPLSLCFDLLTLLTRSVFGVFFLMWSPGIASIVARLIMHEGFQDISFRLGGRKTLLAIGIGSVFPLVIGLIAYGVGWLSGLAPLVPYHVSPSLATVQVFFSPATPDSIRVLLAFLYLTIIALVCALGEEIGWRGYLLLHLIDARVPRPILVGGLFWSFWHWPLLLFELYLLGMPVLLSAGIFVVTITCLGYVCARLRLETGSIWPSVFVHAAWNSILVETFDAFTRGSNTSLWTGEPGLLVAATMLLAAFLFSRGSWRMLRYPPTRVN